MRTEPLLKGGSSDSLESGCTENGGKNHCGYRSVYRKVMNPETEGTEEEVR